MEDVTKLPKWAQEKIRLLEMRLAEARAENTEIAEGNTDTFVEGRLGLPDKYLPNRTEVTFRIGPDRRNVIRVRNEKNHIYINGDDALMIEPWVTNVVKVRLK